MDRGTLKRRRDSAPFSSDQSPYGDGNNYGNTHIGGIGSNVVLGNYNVHYHTETSGHMEEASLAAVVEALEFDGRSDRFCALSRCVSQPTSFDWIWESPFVDWLKTEDRLFWICGKPGSGKSTLMLHLARSYILQHLLRDIHSSEWKVVHHFFDFRTENHIGNNFEGLVRSLLLQIIDEFPDTASQLTKLQELARGSKRRRYEKATAISMDDCCAALTSLVQHVPNLTLVLIDGLDEYGGNIQALLGLVAQLSSSTRLKVCLASRPIPPYSEVLGKLPALRMEAMNTKSIRNYVRDSLGSFFAWSPSLAELDLDRIVSETTRKAEGIFLWAAFAVETLTMGISETHDPTCALLEHRLAQVPPELDSIYSRIIDQIPVDLRPLAAFVLLLLTSATHSESLGLETLREAAELCPPDLEGFVQVKSLAQLGSAKSQSVWKARVAAATRGLVEFIESEFSHESSVRILHKSVQTYLKRIGWRRLLGADCVPGFASKLWILIFMAKFKDHYGPAKHLLPAQDDWHTGVESYIEDFRGKMIGPDEKSHRSPETDTPVQYLLDHALYQVFEYASRYEAQTGLSTYEFLKNGLPILPILSTSNKSLWLEYQPLQFYTSQNTIPMDDIAPCQKAMKIGMALYLRDYLQEAPNALMVFSRSQFGDYNLCEIWNPEINTKICQGDRNNVIIRRKEFVLAYALDLAILVGGRYNDQHLLDMLTVALYFCKGVSKYRLFTAMINASPRIIDLLLRQDIDYLPWEVDQEECEWLVRCKDLITQPKSSKIEMRPFWPLGKRLRHYKNALDGTRELENIIDILVIRGECINEVCGPFGTILHSLVDTFHLESPHDVIVAMAFELLIRKGLDVSIQGPYGNALEFGWTLGNTIEFYSMITGRQIVRLMIAAGATNTRPDPNGLIPSRQLMLNWCNTWSEYDWKSYYMKGGVSPPELDVRFVIIMDCSADDRKRGFEDGDILEIVGSDYTGWWEVFNHRTDPPMVQAFLQDGGSKVRPWMGDEGPGSAPRTSRDLNHDQPIQQGSESLGDPGMSRSL